MIFAEFKCQPNVVEILTVLKDAFHSVQSADQGTFKDPDAYFWIFKNDMKVSVDNLTSIEFQVKSEISYSKLVHEVIDVLIKSFDIDVFNKPELEVHE